MLFDIAGFRSKTKLPFLKENLVNKTLLGVVHNCYMSPEFLESPTTLICPVLFDKFNRRP